MTWEERTDQLAVSATLYKTGPVDDWKKELQVPDLVRNETDKLEMHRKYHLNMAFELSLHLSLCQDEGPIFVALNQLFNFALIELRFAEIVSLDHHFEKGFITLVQDKKILYVTALALFRVRETIYDALAKNKLGLKLSRIFETGDLPIPHDGLKTLQKLILSSIKYMMETMDLSIRKLKGIEATMEKDFMELLVEQLGFVIHMMNRVIKASDQ